MPPLSRMIYGTGIDIVAIERIRKSLEKFPGRFEAKIFTPGEISYCRTQADPPTHFAGRFAVKEAVLKSLGTGMLAGISWKDLEVINDGDTGKPILRVAGGARRMFEHLGLKQIHISISHDKTHAVAQAIAES